MRLTCKKFLAAALLVACQGASAGSLQHIQESGELELCANPFQPPFSSRQEQPARGLHLDMARAIANKLNVGLKVSWIVQKRHAKKTSCDLYAGVARLGDGESKYVKITQPYTRMEFKLVTAEGSASIAKLADLKDKTVAVAAGSIAAHKVIEQGIDFAIRFNDEQSRLEAVRDGLVDAAIVSNATVGWLQQRGSQFKVYDAEQMLATDLNYDYALALRKADKNTLKEFNKLLKDMKYNGELQQILKPYGMSAL